VLLVGFLFLLLQNYGYMKVPEYIRKLLDEITGENRALTVRNYILIALGFSAATGAALFFMRRLIISVSRKIEYNLRQDLYEKILGLDFEFYQDHQTGDLISRCTNDLNDVRTLLGPGIMYIPNSLTRLALFIPVLIGISGELMIYVGASMVLLVIFIVVFMPRMRPLFQKVQEQIGAINSRAWQIVSGITTIKLYTTEEIEKKRFAELNEEYLKRQMKLVKFRGVMRPFFFFIFSIIEFVLLVVGGRQVIEGSLSLGQLLQFNTMVSVLIFPVLSLGWVMSLLQQGISAMERINTIFDHPVERRDDWRSLDGDPIDFSVRNLTFTYPNAAVPSLNDITLDIPSGSVIGITGGVGSGKSTLINLLAGLIKPERGMIRINGTDIRDIEPESLYRKLAVVPQEPFLFSATVAENINLGDSDQVDMERVRTAAQMASFDQDVEGFRDGYDQMVGERGITLSGGQKQRTSIARAWRKDGDVVIFDDSLSSVDSKTADSINRNMNTLKGKKTVIIISHRIDVIKDCDVIYVFHDGRIEENGTHDELVCNQGQYARIWELQNIEEKLAVSEFATTEKPEGCDE
jgi:ATP-binding cassette, subfamily B, multidrug efflux pump